MRSQPRVIFLGVGEAFDENLVNNSHLIDSTSKLLLDCGYSIPRHLWKHFPGQDFLDAVYLSHAHADHYLGIPILLARLWEERRLRPLKIICQPEIRKNIPSVLEFAYPGLFDRLPFPIEFIEIRQGDRVLLEELTLEFAASNHSISNCAIKVQVGNKSICYSGDGMFNAATKQLYRAADLLIHETYTLEPGVPTHANVKEVILMCDEVGVKHLALTHLKRDVRRDKDHISEYIQKYANRVKVIFPEPLDEFKI